MRIYHAAGGLMMALALAGCQRTASMDSVNTQPNLAPLEAQPIGTVSSSQLPDPTTGTSSACVCTTTRFAALMRDTSLWKNTVRAGGPAAVVTVTAVASAATARVPGMTSC